MSAFSRGSAGREGALAVFLLTGLARSGWSAEAPKVTVTEARIRAFTVDLSATGAEEIATKFGDPRIEHFVAARQAGQAIELSATVVPAAATTFARGNLSWAGATPDAMDSLKATVPRSSAMKTAVQLSQGTRVVRNARTWVVWSSLSAPVDIPITIIDPVNISGGRPGAFIRGGYDFKHTISPAALFIDPDRPDLTGTNVTLPPGGNHPLSQLPLSGGANAKWDASRQGRFKILNPNGIANSAFTWPPPVTANYPTSPVEGNDDALPGDEFNDPDATSGLLATCVSAFPISHSRGSLESCDSPAFGIAHDAGIAGNTWEYRVHFREFSRLELNGVWTRISDDFLWRFHMRLKKIVTEISTGPDGIAHTPALGNDVQVIALGRGKPLSDCISPGGNGALDTSTLGDDQVSGVLIDSGVNGLCESIAAGDDLQLIGIGKGEPGTTAVSSGSDAVIDSLPARGDDVGLERWADDGSEKALDNAGF